MIKCNYNKRNQPISNVYAVANCFIELFKKNNKQLSHIKLQILVYYAYGFYLYYNNKELFENNFQPWAWGPIDCGLLKAVKKAGNSRYNVTNNVKEPEYKVYYNLISKGNHGKS